MNSEAISNAFQGFVLMGIYLVYRVYTLNIQNKDHERALYFIVKIENVYVLTHFLKKANHEK